MSESQKRKQVDWDAIEPDWRAGTKSKQQLAAEFGVSRAAIDKHFAKAGIDRDLTERIRAKADALVTQDAVTREVTFATKIAEKEIVEANAEMQASVRREQRTDITRSRKLVIKMLGELEQETGDLDLFLQLGELLRNDDDKGQDKRNDIYTRVISSAGRVDSMKKLADTLKTLVSLERQAFSIDDDKVTSAGITVTLFGFDEDI